MRAATIAISLLALLCVRPTQYLAEEPGILEGFAYRADSAQPIAVSGATVWLDSDHDSRTTTDENGHFRFTGVRAGSHSVSVGAEGYVLAEYGQRAPGKPGAPITVSEGKKLDPLVFQLVPTGSATGMLRDYDNEPVANVLLQLLRERYRPNGERFLVPVDSVRTDDRGIFRFYWITPGEYFLAASPRAPFGALSGKPNLTPRVNRVPTYFPGVTSPAQAIPVVVRPGETTDSLLMSLIEPRTSTVRGTIKDSRTGKGIQARLRLYLPNVGMIDERQSDVDGSYEFNDIPVGAYTIDASLSMGEVNLRGSRSFELEWTPLTDLDVRIDPGLKLEGRVVTEDGRDADLSRLMVHLPALTSVRADGRFEAEIHRESLSLSLAFPDEYADYYVKSARLGRIDVLHAPYAVDDAIRDPLEVVISAASARVQGVILDSLNTPQSGAQIVLVRVGQARARAEDYRVTYTDQNGAFTIRGIPPGEYRLIAWEATDENAYYSPEFLRQYDRDSTRLTLQGYETLDLRLPLIVR